MNATRGARLVAWAVLAAAGALVWAAIGGGGPVRADVEEDPPEQESIRGDTLYTTHCARCHGADGTGGQQGGAPPLVGMEAARVDLVLRTGRMPPARPDGAGKGPIQWDDDSREALLAHLTAVFDLEDGIPVPEEGDAAVGREVFATHCAACHGYTGDGGVAGGGALVPRLVGLDPVVIAEAARVGPFQMPRFGESQVSDDELGHVAAYLEEVANEEGTLLNLVEINPVFMAAFVALMTIVMVLGCLWIAGRVTLFPDPAPTAADAEETGGGRA